MHRETTAPASWNNTTVEVTARLIPRYAWTTASIDVAIGGDTVLDTGGVPKIVGSHAGTFEFHGVEHSIEITWGEATLHSFPYRLFIDGLPLLASRVPISNWWLALWPWAILTGFSAWAVLN